MSIFKKHIKNLAGVVALIKKEIPEMQRDRKEISTGLGNVVSRLSTALSAAQKYENKLVNDAESFASDRLWLIDADESIDELEELIKLAKNAGGDEAALQKNVKKGAESYLGNNGVTWKKPLVAQQATIIKGLKAELANYENRGEKIAGTYPTMEAKLLKHFEKHDAAVKTIEELLKKLDAVQI